MPHVIYKQDSRINKILSGYATSCKALGNITFTANQTALVLPHAWDGPLDIVLPFGSAVIAIIVGAFIGFSLLLVLSNM